MKNIDNEGSDKAFFIHWLLLFYMRNISEFQYRSTKNGGPSFRIPKNTTQQKAKQILFICKTDI